MQPIGDLIEGTESFNKSAVPYRYPIKQAIFEFVFLNKLRIPMKAATDSDGKAATFSAARFGGRDRRRWVIV